MFGVIQSLDRPFDIELCSNLHLNLSMSFCVSLKTFSWVAPLSYNVPTTARSIIFCIRDYGKCTKISSKKLTAKKAKTKRADADQTASEV